MKVLVGDILKSQAQTLVNTVNCVGVMGKGIALEFKKHFPDMYEDYERRIERREVLPGVPYLYKRLIPPQIVNFPTKTHWRAASRIEYVDKGLRILLAQYKEWGITSLAVPPLGCGNGQLLWTSVGPLMYRYLKELDVPVEIYAPYGTPPAQLSEAFLSKSTDVKNAGSGRRILEKIRPSWIALVEILHQIERQPYHRPVGRTTFQKLAFVATEQEIETGLEYVKGSYGPYSRGLDEIKKRLSDANLLREERLGRMFEVKTGSAYPETRTRFVSDLDRWKAPIAKTVDLFLRMDTAQAELTATVLFAANRIVESRAATEKDVFDAVMEWKQRRRPKLEPDSVGDTIRNLAMLRWINVEASSDLPGVIDEFA